MDGRQSWQIEWRGREAFDVTWQRQRELHAARRADPAGTSDTLIFVEHEPVVTLGKHGDLSNLLGGEAVLATAGIAFRRIERGGDITYHGPGQLVGYPIVHLRERGLSLRDYMRGLEEVLILTLGQFDLPAERIPGLTGVWVDGHKMAAIGVAVQGGVTLHGFALNVNPTLEHFKYIIPCGISDRPVGSMAKLLGVAACPAMGAVRQVATEQFEAVFGCHVSAAL